MDRSHNSPASLLMFSNIIPSCFGADKLEYCRLLFIHICIYIKTNKTPQTSEIQRKVMKHGSYSVPVFHFQCQHVYMQISLLQVFGSMSHQGFFLVIILRAFCIHMFILNVNL